MSPPIIMGPFFCMVAKAWAMFVAISGGKFSFTRPLVPEAVMISSCISGIIGGRSDRVKVFYVFWSCLAWPLVAGIVSLHFVLSFLILHLPFLPRKMRFVEGLAVWFLKAIFAVCLVWFEVEGAENVPEGPVIVMPNHASMLDIVLMMIAVPKVRFIAKKELGQVPILGWNMAQMGNYFIDRENPRKAVKLLQKARKDLEAGGSVCVFPEGTRTENGDVGEFKLGSFKLAVETGVPIVPARIRGTFERFPKGQFFVRPGIVKVSLGEAVKIECGEDSKEEMGRLSKLVKMRVLALD